MSAAVRNPMLTVREVYDRIAGDGLSACAFWREAGEVGPMSLATYELTRDVLRGVRDRHGCDPLDRSSDDEEATS